MSMYPNKYQISISDARCISDAFFCPDALDGKTILDLAQKNRMITPGLIKGAICPPCSPSSALVTQFDKDSRKRSKNEIASSKKPRLI